MRDRLQQDLRLATRARDRDRVSVLRSVLAAIANAEAVDVDRRAATSASAATVAGTSVGVGSSDVPRRQLTEDDIANVLRAEVAERRQAADDIERAGRPEQATSLRAEADLVEHYLP